MSCARIFNVLEFSDEILIKIMSNLSARERALLGNTCKKFYGLAFGEKRFVRNLDFSKDGYLTSSIDIQQYFKDVTMCQHMRTINLGSMYCSSPEPMLQDFKKAVNLVELNIIGIKFHNFSDFGSLLNPLENLRKLSAGWPEFHVPVEVATMKKPFSRLKDLTMRVDNHQLLDTFIPVLLRYSQQLEKLFILVVFSGSLPYNATNIHEALGGLELVQLPNLKIAAGYNMDFQYLPLGEILRQILPDHEQWTQFYVDSREMLYYEKDAELTPEMISHIRIIAQPAINGDGRPTKFLMPGRLLADMIENAAGADSRNYYLRTYAREVSLKIEDIKLLLDNPSHQISYIHMNHDLEPSCTEYLSAFSYLTKLVLGGVISKAGKGVFGDFDGLNREVTPNLSFSKLVRSTPHMKDFTVYPKSRNNYYYVWDLNAPYLISGWKELTTLFLARIPIENGSFLIEIGKHCENLEKLRLEDLGPYSDCCYKDELRQMLSHCRNLKDFSIEQNNLGRLSDMFTMFGGNHKLRRFHMITYGDTNTFDNLVPATEEFIRSHNLILFACEFKDLGVDAHNDLESNLQRLKNELGRTSFEFEIVDSRNMGSEVEYTERNHSLEFAHKDLILPFSIINALYQLGC